MATASPDRKNPDSSYEPPAEGNVYASKTELLEWVNGLLELQLSKLEQFASGAVFCQMLDAYFSSAIPMHKINYHASNEYDALVNYKVLQQGFTAINLTRDIHIGRLSRGSRVELLELLQYLYKYLLKLKAQEGYDAHERRALTAKGDIHNIPVPGWLSTSHGAGRAGLNRSSGNWSTAAESQPSARSQMRASGSFKRAASHTATGRPSTAAAAASSPEKGDRLDGGPHRPCMPARVPSAKPGRDAQAAPAAAGRADETADKDDESGVSVFRVVDKDEEAASACVATDDPGTTRLVIPDDVISSTMHRPLDPVTKSQLEVCLAVAEEAISVISKSSSNMKQISSSLPTTTTDSYVYRGKIRSLQDASATAVGHVALLLNDVAAVCERKTDGSADDVKDKALKLQQGLTQAQAELAAATQELQAATAARPLSGQQQLNLQLTQMQKQLASSAAVDGSLRAIGTAYAALKVLKLGDCSMKRLRNGDVYKGRYKGSRKNGDGTYCFLNQDVYEGEFKDDRMAGCGVYSFAPEGRYEGDWATAVYEGCGSETFSKGSTYHGQYAGGLRHGWGMCRFFNGDYYEGQWSKGLRDGTGMQQCTDDSNYVGDYQRGKRHGYGVYSFPNGDQYLGEYEDDIPQGYGVYVFGSGQRYEGHWDKGKKHGWSIYTVETGQRWAGSWVEGKPQWVHPLPQDGTDNTPEPAPEVADNLTHAFAACKNAQEAGQLAQVKLQGHWEMSGGVQQGLQTACTGAEQAAAAAQAARRRAQLLSGRLDAAATLVDNGSRIGNIQLAGAQ
eukprot:gene12192-12329_t